VSPQGRKSVSRIPKSVKVLIGTVVGGVLVAIATYEANRGLDVIHDQGIPFEWTVALPDFGECSPKAVVDRPEREARPPDNLAELATWAKQVGALHGSHAPVHVTLQGRSDRAVVLLAMRPKVRPAPAPRHAFAVGGGCGGGLAPRSFTVDLDAPVPAFVAESGREVVPGGPGKPDKERILPAIDFPYKISSTEPEVFYIRPVTMKCDCRWSIELQWSSGADTGWVEIDDQGMPFRAIGTEGKPAYGYDLSTGKWHRSGARDGGSGVSGDAVGDEPPVGGGEPER
jgi:hypothetical protein